MTKIVEPGTNSVWATPKPGGPRLREVIASTYDNVAPEHVLVFAGAEEAVFLAMQVLLSADDHAIVITPNYEATETIPLAICEGWIATWRLNSGFGTRRSAKERTC